MNQLPNQTVDDDSISSTETTERSVNGKDEYLYDEPSFVSTTTKDGAEMTLIRITADVEDGAWEVFPRGCCGMGCRCFVATPGVIRLIGSLFLAGFISALILMLVFGDPEGAAGRILAMIPLFVFASLFFVCATKQCGHGCLGQHCVCFGTHLFLQGIFTTKLFYTNGWEGLKRKHDVVSVLFVKDDDPFSKKKRMGFAMLTLVLAWLSAMVTGIGEHNFFTAAMIWIAAFLFNSMLKKMFKVAILQFMSQDACGGKYQFFRGIVGKVLLLITVMAMTVGYVFVLFGTGNVVSGAWVLDVLVNTLILWVVDQIILNPIKLAIQTHFEVHGDMVKQEF